MKDGITGDSWARYLANMSQQGTWAEALIIQAVADAFHLTINIIESNQGFSPHTAICPVAMPGHELTVINIGHTDEIHYVSTIPYNDQCPQVIGNKTVAVVNTLSKEDRRARKRERIRKKRENKKFKYKANKAKQDKRSAWIEKTIESQRQAFKKRKESNPTHIRNLNRKAFKKQKESNPNHMRDLNRKAFLKRKENNLEHIRELNKNAQNRKRFHSSQLLTNHHELLQPARKKQNCTMANGTHEMNMAKVIQSLYDSIKCGPEYICTCCDQLWYRSSVTKCDANKYTKCTKHLLDVCITGETSVDNMEYVCSTCHSNLSDGKLPVCSKANKMTFPVKPERLNLTPLEERLISPRIPFMQIHELPRGGQLSIHGNVVNVPADVNSVVNTLPRPINESQTIPIKLKRKLSYKHHYQFQSVRPRKVLEAAKHLVETSELFQKEHIEVQDNWLNNVNSTSLSERDDWVQFVNSSTTVVLIKQMKQMFFIPVMNL